jgi:hypothetical protein
MQGATWMPRHRHKGAEIHQKQIEALNRCGESMRDFQVPRFIRN